MQRVFNGPLVLAVCLTGCASVPEPIAPPVGAGYRTDAGTSVSRSQAPGGDPKSAQPQPPKTPPGVIDLPPGLPGGEGRLPDIPPDTAATRPQRLKVLDVLFPAMPDLGPDPLVDGPPGAKLVTLEELTDIGRRNSPVIAQAAAEIENRRGQWLQAGLYPNPTVGYQADQVANLGSAGQQGGYFEQPIVLNHRLRLGRAVAYQDLIVAKLRLRRAEAEVCAQIRSSYYAVLVAAETVRVNRLVAELTDESYRREVGMVRGGSAPPSDAAALRAVAGQTRAALITARNRYVSAWKQLAAAVNAPDMPPAPLAGRADAEMPRLRYDAIRDRVLAGHTDLEAARAFVAQAEAALRLEQKRPVPDIQDHFYVQRDTQARSFQVGVSLGVTLPVWNRNQGAIASAASQLARYEREGERVRNDLVRQLADAYERYETARALVALYRVQILPDLARAFRGLSARYQIDTDKVNYNDLVTAQQNIAAQLANYLQALQQQWQASSDLAGLIQTCNIGDLAGFIDPGDAADAWPATAVPPVPSTPPAPGEM